MAEVVRDRSWPGPRLGQRGRAPQDVGRPRSELRDIAAFTVTQVDGKCF
jgi:hypothetical protein